MRDKHLYIEEDAKLLRAIHRAVQTKLVVDKRNFFIVMLAKCLFYVCVSSMLYFSLFVISEPWLFAVAFVGYGFAILLLAFNFAHDFSHNTIFKNPWWNEVFFIVIYALNGAHAEAWKKRHVESHHFAPNVEHYDSDLEISSLIRVMPQSPFRALHRFQYLYAPLLYTTYSFYWVFIKDFYIFHNTKGKSLRYTTSFVAQKIFYLGYLLALPILYSSQSWLVVLVCFLLMHFCQSLFLLFTFFMTHHVEGVEYPSVDAHGNIQTSWIMNQIKSSNDMHPFSPFANFIFGGFNNHIAHHLFPHVHHIHYPRLNRILYSVLNDHGVSPNRTTYWGGIYSHLKLLRRMSKA